ncbi:hypothetical protein DPEC_G00361740 [Dallia pectoralis]|nr:hypothetical protein DPEC_G00361740 [Dallia pectoralis]
MPPLFPSLTIAGESHRSGFVDPAVDISPPPAVFPSAAAGRCNLPVPTPSGLLSGSAAPRPVIGSAPSQGLAGTPPHTKPFPPAPCVTPLEFVTSDPNLVQLALLYPGAVLPAHQSPGSARSAGRFCPLTGGGSASSGD